MERINITFDGGRGHMTILLDTFFPSNRTRLRRLLAVIDEDWEHREELLATCRDHCERRLEALGDSLKVCANDAVSYGEAAAAMQPDIEKLEHHINYLSYYLRNGGSRRIGRGKAKALREKIKNEKVCLLEKKKVQHDREAASKECQRRHRRLKAAQIQLAKNRELIEGAMR